MGPQQPGVHVPGIRWQAGVTYPATQADVNINAAKPPSAKWSFRSGLSTQKITVGQPPPPSQANSTSSSESKSTKFVTTRFERGVRVITRDLHEDKPPPSKRRRKEAPTAARTKATIFTTRRPLKNSEDVHKDIWKHILSFCEPAFLLDARYIDSVRHEILSRHQAIWRDSRQRHFGEACPPCPSRITEQQYANLLVGRGCQVRTCSQKNITTVSWMFLARLCPDCLKSRTVQLADLPPERRYRLSDSSFLHNALPMGDHAGGRYGAPRSLNRDATEWLFGNGKYVLLKSDYDDLEAAYLSRRSHNLSDAELLEWWQTKMDDNIRHMEETRKIYMWVNQRRWDIEGSNMEERKHFFVQKAAKLNPTMTEEELMCMEATHKALRSANRASDQAWDILEAKILPHRGAANRVLLTRVDGGYWDADHDSSQLELRTHRIGRYKTPRSYTPEQDFVLELGRKEYAKCLESNVEDQSLVLTCLKNVFDEYQLVKRKPHGLNPDNTEGPYVLSMDDARMIFEDIIEPDTRGGSVRRTRVLGSFKCPGCRNGQQAKMDFVDCVKHVYKKHSGLVGDSGEFYRLLKDSDNTYGTFPFYSTPWMRCLPVLPAYCDARSVRPWMLDNEMDFIGVGVTDQASAFEGRTASWTGDQPTTFVEALIHAFKTMRGTTLKGAYVLKIACTYASDLSAAHNASFPPLDDFMTAITAVQDDDPALQFKLRCANCVSADDPTDRPSEPLERARVVKYEVPIPELHQHWKKKHDEDDLDWTRDFMLMATDEELKEEMGKSDEKLKKEKDAILAFDPAKQRKRKMNPKAGVILGQKFAMEGFDVLFPKNG